jgi:hypothetical protein
MSTVAFIRRCMASGMDLETALIAAEAFEETAPLFVPPPSTGAERTRKWREKKAQQASPSVTERHGDVTERHGDASPLSLETKVPPTPPSKTQTLSPSKNPPKGGQKGSRRCPAAWLPSPSTLEVLEGEGHSPGDLERALTRMRDHEFRTARTDWDATFRNWVRADADRKPRQAHDRPYHDQRQAARQDNLGRVLSGLMAAVDEREPDVGGRDP